MIDWFVALTPLILLPLFLALGFLGCGLDRSGTPLQPVRLIIGPGFDDHIATLSVMFTFFTPSGAPSPSHSAVETLQNADIPSEGGSIDKSDEFAMHTQPAGDLICTCNITKKDTLENVTKALGQQHKPDDGIGLGIFELTFDGDNFDITLVEGEIVYVGGI